MVKCAARDRVIWAMPMILAATGCMAVAGSNTNPAYLDGGVIDLTVNADAGTPVESDPCEPTQRAFRDLADVHKYTISRSCSLGIDTCHHDEDPPTMHTVGHLFNLINMPCNLGVAETSEWDSFCVSGVTGETGVLVKPGNAEESYLMIRLTADARSRRTPMPWGAQALTQEELYVIRAWINGLVPELSTPHDPIDYSKTPCPL